MRERPIIFNADMVRAVLDGRKTQTRRIMREQPEVIPKEDEFDQPGFWIPFNAGKTMVRNEDMYIACPFGLKGDRLWVRETWSVVSHAFDDDGLMIDYAPDRPAKAVHEKPFGRGYYSGHAIYAADGGFTWGDDDGCVDGRSCWKPSIHMPRWASRITLEITGVRVERLNSMTESDALAEGCNGGHDSIPGYMYSATPHEHFHHVWQSIYGADSWQANPWVWVIEFTRVEGDQ
ncbi:MULTISPECIES: hypothetical protein [Pantoea]|jgi:hypothetical protein|uniref:Morphogenetic protein n=2 Tax=root TaxID=1 RepID=A0A7Y6TTY2_9GAMM|nr:MULTISPECIES: hypothetical protein [Pantoea]MBZ6397243.1 hypothetical protein [Pantoea sp.]MBZ6440463.1 hypothetical protein [Pantoea sp.]NUY43802.1 hypothetical protein [Pantoea brenneri]NUY51321.1 hypothetical protein [Pantoea brenneri]NUY61632.1 hypothetical protein [Pantoea brenneri]